MRCLLDTHTAFWYFTNNPKLSEKAKMAIDDSENDIFVSIVSAWEIAIKRSVRRNNEQLCTAEDFFNKVKEYWFELLELKPQHICPIATLPLHHRDPFDRLLISAAISENMTFLSADENASKYPVNHLW